MEEATSARKQPMLVTLSRPVQEQHPVAVQHKDDWKSTQNPSKKTKTWIRMLIRITKQADMLGQHHDATCTGLRSLRQDEASLNGTGCQRCHTSREPGHETHLGAGFWSNWPPPSTLPGSLLESIPHSAICRLLQPSGETRGRVMRSVALLCRG